MKPQRESISNYLGQDSSPYLKPPQFTKLSDFDTADMDQLRIELLRISPSFAFFDDLAGLKSKRISKKDRFLRLYLEAANATMISAAARKESRGAHSHDDHPNRDDNNWMKHTLWYSEGNRLDYKPVVLKPLTVESFPPKERTF